MGKLLRLPKDLKDIPCIEQEGTTSRENRKELCSTAVALLVMLILICAIVSAIASAPSPGKTAVAGEKVVRK